MADGAAKIKGARIIKLLHHASVTNRFVVPCLEFKDAARRNSWCATQGDFALFYIDVFYY